MKLLTDRSEVHSRGVKEVVDYQVCNSAHVMQLLSDSTYNDKIKAPIRELCTNAWDSHIDAHNTDVLPLITLPSVDEPKFSIRDYGTGMSKDKVMTMYRTYGVSDKTEGDNANDFNGCLGIGSKSPFAYTESEPFVATSYYNGMKYVFVNLKNEHGRFSLELIHEGETDEPNGFEVSFEVKQEDINTFYHRTIEVMRFFPKCFKVEGCDSEFSLPERMVLLEGDDWTIYQDVDTAVATMGNVGYPIDHNKFSKWEEGRSWMRGNHEDEPYYDILSTGIELNFELGELLPNMGRESLQYKDFVTQAIKDKLDIVVCEVGDNLSGTFAKAPSLWDARLEYQKMTSGKMQSIKSMLKIATLQWNGHKLDNSRVRVSDIDGCTVHLFEGGHTTPKHHKNCSNVTVRSTMPIIVNDINHGAYKACQRLFDQSDPNNRNTHVLLVRFEDDAAKKAFLDRMGLLESHLIYASSLPKPARRARGSCGVRDNTKVFKYKAPDYFQGHINRMNDRKDLWVGEIVDFNAGGIYVEINRFQPVTLHGMTRNCGVIARIFLHLSDFGVDAPVLVGVKSSTAHKFKADPRWINLFDWAKEKAQDVLKKHDFSIARNLEGVAHFNWTDTYDSFGQRSIVKQFNSRKNQFVKFARRIRLLKKKRKKNLKNYQAATRLSQTLGVDIPDRVGIRVTRTELEDEHQKLMDAYPMLSRLDRSKWSDAAGEIIEYVNLVESHVKSSNTISN